MEHYTIPLQMVFFSRTAVARPMGKIMTSVFVAA